MIDEKLNNINVLHNYVVLDVLDREEKSSKGVIIWRSFEPKYANAIVLKVGNGVYNKKHHLIEPEVKVGDKVLVPIDKLEKMTINGEKVSTIRENEILMILD